MTRPTAVHIDLSAIRQNLHCAKHAAPNSRLMGCVKADAYGHGLLPVSQTIAEEADGLAVASLDEALALRDAGLRTPILLLEGVFNASEIPHVVAEELWTVVHSFEQIEMLKKDAARARLGIWLKMDSGMHRLGFSPDEYIHAYKSLMELDNITDIVHMTHFSSADELRSRETDMQLDKFLAISGSLPGQCSTANSAAILAWQRAHLDWIRPGFMLYGASPLNESHPIADRLAPAMEFVSEVIAVRDIAAGEGVGYNKAWRAERDSRIAIVAAGYGDGYPRNTVNGTPVLIDGIRSSTVGHVAMDMMTVDITGLNGVKVGSSVELWGKHLPINEVASSSGYSPYELMTRLTPRAKRVYHADIRPS